MPQLGETVAEGKISKWFVKAGDAVNPGNNMFATLGNLLEDGRCSLLFPAYGEGRSLQVAGRARVEKYTNGDIDLDTGRAIRVAVEHVIEE